MIEKNSKKTSVEEKYFDKIYGFINFKDSIKLIDFLFEKPWWDIFLKQKTRLVVRLISNIILFAYLAILPLLIGLAVNAENLNMLVVVLFGLLFVYVMNFFTVKISIIFRITVIYNLMFNAHKYFQTVDPTAHSTRSSGQIISKVGRLEKAYNELISLAEEDIVPFFIKTVTLAIVLSSFSLVLGLLATLFIVLAALCDWLTRVFINLVFSKKKILAHDTSRSTEIESLAQVQHIRSVFATTEQLNKLRNQQAEMYSVIGAANRSNNYSVLLTRLVLLLGTSVLSWQVFSMIGLETLDKTVGISLLITFISSSGDSIAIGKRFEKAMEAIIEIKDTFTFIRGFGKQSFPVLEEDGEIQNAESRK